MHNRNNTKSRNSSNKAKKLTASRNRSLVIVIFSGIFIIAVVYMLLPRSKNALIQETASVSMGIGQALYKENCASCHGSRGEGHIEMNAPALDDSEHAWHHADGQLIQIIRSGGFNMPPVGAEMSDAEIELIIAHIKNWWTEEQKGFQAGDIGEE